VLADLHSLKKELDEYLNSQRKYFGCKVTVYILFKFRVCKSMHHHTFN